MTIEDQINYRRSVEVGILVIAIIVAIGMIADGTGGKPIPHSDRRAESAAVTATVTSVCATREQELATNE